MAPIQNGAGRRERERLEKKREGEGGRERGCGMWRTLLHIDAMVACHVGTGSTRGVFGT
jgi:hypothetical protein